MCAQPSPGDHVEEDERQDETAQHGTQHVGVAGYAAGADADDGRGFTHRSEQHHFLKFLFVCVALLENIMGILSTTCV